MLWGRPSVPQHERAQREVKADLLMAGSALLGVDALGVGKGDLVFGLDFLTAGAAKHGLPYVATNLRTASGEPVFPPTLVVEKGDLKLGLASVLPESAVGDGYKAAPVAETLPGALKMLADQGVDLVVLLSNLGTGADQDLARRYEGIDLIFGSGSRKHQEEPLLVGETAIFSAGSRGKYVGQATFHLVEGATGWHDPGARERALRIKDQVEKQLQRYDKQLTSADEKSRSRIERGRQFAQKRLDELVIPDETTGGRTIEPSKVAMSGSLADEAAMKKLVDEALAKLGDVAPGAGQSSEPDKAEAPSDYLGAGACLGCHQDQTADWKTTSHARAYATLVREKRHFDTDCWSCHVTGAHQPGGPSTPHDVGQLMNVQCEACHGPGKEHVLSAGKGKILRSPPEKLCLTCHTEEQTEGRFVYSDYLPKVDHAP